jgi:hypothetical protein
MKIRIGYVSNSSSCSFIIENKSNKELTIVDFVKENPQLITDFLGQYSSYKNDHDFSQENLILSAEGRLKESKEGYMFLKKSQKILEFGDGDGDLIGSVFDYILRDGGESENFTWNLREIQR